MIGSVVVPLLVAFALITIGQRMASNYQDWQDRRSRARNTVELLRVAASGLSGQLETLAQQGGAMERLRSERSPLDEYAVVKKTFSQISGASRALPPDTAAMGVQKDLRGQLAVCEESIESYMNCLSTTGLDPSRAPGAQPCTSTFRKNLEREGSCSSVEATAYSLRY